MLIANQIKESAVTYNASNGSGEYEGATAAGAIDHIIAGLERAVVGLNILKSLMSDGKADADFDPKDPANKHEVGGLMKLTPRGEEICYRLFDAAKSRYAVASLMDISFGAATHRKHAWEKLGGANRVKRPLV